MSNFMRAIDRVHAERQLLTAFTEQMGWSDIDLFFKRLRVPRPKFEDDYSIADLVRGYLRECSDDLLLEIGDQLGLTVPKGNQGNGLIAFSAPGQADRAD